nr:hypothetical protein [Pyrinomonadaceae bacterium]
ETHELIAAAARFRFRRFSDTIYEIRPPTDATANDTPDFQRLLERPPSKVQRLKV